MVEIFCEVFIVLSMLSFLGFHSNRLLVLSSIYHIKYGWLETNVRIETESFYNLLRTFRVRSRINGVTSHHCFEKGLCVFLLSYFTYYQTVRPILEKMRSTAKTKQEIFIFEGPKAARTIFNGFVREELKRLTNRMMEYFLSRTAILYSEYYKPGADNKSNLSFLFGLVFHFLQDFLRKIKPDKLI